MCEHPESLASCITDGNFSLSCRYNSVGPVFIWWVFHYPIVVVNDSESLKVTHLLQCTHMLL